MSSYTKETVRAIIKGLERGIPIKHCAAAAGITHDTYYRWLAKYPNFVKQTEAAHAAFIARNVELVYEASVNDWKAAGWLLERKCPDEYGKRERVDSHVTHENEQKHEVVVTFE
jgi:hypothetical protein